MTNIQPKPVSVNFTQRELADLIVSTSLSSRAFSNEAAARYRRLKDRLVMASIEQSNANLQPATDG